MVAHPWVGAANASRKPEFDRTINGVAEDGALNSPMGVAASPADDGRIYVVDAGNARIQVYAPTLNVIGHWGQRGMGHGQFWQPADVAVSPNGTYVYVVDQSRKRVYRFRPDPDCFQPPNLSCFNGARVAQFGGSGTGDGLFQEPTGIAVDSDGNVLVADRGAHEVQKFDPDGRFIQRFGGYGTEAGKLFGPTDVAIGPDNRVVVADTLNDRIAVFRSDGQPEVQFGTAFLHRPSGVALDQAGNTLIRDYHPSFSHPRLWQVSAERRTVWKEPLVLGGQDADVALSFPLQGSAFLRDGTAIVADQFAPLYSLLRLALGREPRLTPVAVRGRSLSQFDYPVDVALDESFLAVSDYRNNRVLILDPSSDYQAMGMIGGDLGTLDPMKPRGIAVHRTGRGFDEARIYVADAAHNVIHVLSPDGRKLDQWGTGVPLRNRDGFNMPRDVTVDQAGTVYIADTGNHRIMRRSPSGEVVGEPIGSTGLGEGQLMQPYALTVGPPGDVLYVLDYGVPNRLQAFKTDGSFIEQWSSPEQHTADEPIAPGELWQPVALAADHSYLYVLEADPIDHVRVQALDPVPGRPLADGVVAVFAAQMGAGPAELWEPQGLGASPDGQIAVADSHNNRVQLFRWDDPAEPDVPTATDPPTATEPLPSATAPPPSDTPPPTETSAPTSTPTPPPTETPVPTEPAATQAASATPEPPTATSTATTTATRRAEPTASTSTATPTTRPEGTPTVATPSPNIVAPQPDLVFPLAIKTYRLRRR
jgi:DNA-binding beta-propeller fold protein YncE